MTSLLQRCRRADPRAGLWEAADLQWWWRRDQHDDPLDATFWLDVDDRPIAAVVVTDWTDRFSIEVIELPGDDRVDRQALWHHAGIRAEQLDAKPVEASVVDDDPQTRSFITSLGFEPARDAYFTCWMQPSQRRPVTVLADGYRLVTRATSSDRPHHMVPRNGAHVAERLVECSLYRPDLDLAIEGPDGDVAAYGLFWADPVTGVGLVEPMRTEDAHQGRGLGAHVLTAGLERLAAAGCSSLKISFLEGNDTARRLYVGAGFSPIERISTLLRSAR